MNQCVCSAGGHTGEYVKKQLKQITVYRRERCSPSKKGQLANLCSGEEKGK